ASSHRGFGLEFGLCLLSVYRPLGAFWFFFEQCNARCLCGSLPASDSCLVKYANQTMLLRAKKPLSAKH
ncbi:MAG: hypothetical protein P1U67_14615, partial [Alcanivoracaceae bacterium]|nr:hypothetical protein [Alcanivoracaceae bacterium]